MLVRLQVEYQLFVLKGFIKKNPKKKFGSHFSYPSTFHQNNKMISGALKNLCEEKIKPQMEWQSNFQKGKIL